MSYMEKKLAYEDTDIITFGKFKGKMLQDVPASYLHWWVHNTNRDDFKLLNYIKNSLSALKEETPDLVWERF